MRTEERTHVKNSVGRLILVILAVLLQLGWFLFIVLRLNQWFAPIQTVTALLAAVLVLRIYGKHELAAFKMPWIILILVFPIIGVTLYLLFGHKDATRLMRRRFENLDPELFSQLRQDEAVWQRLAEEDRVLANQCRYLRRFGGYPVYQNTDVTFFPDAAQGLEAQLQALAKAESFIFMEYHAIEEGQSFARLKSVLADRASHGVEVRILYDDVGSIGFIDPGFIKRMEAVGVQCRVFNPVQPILNFFMNNRDHRKITVIDGKVGFTGGYNLADEYFNLTHPYGQWKDTGIQLRGDAVRALTVMFLEMWNVMGRTDREYGAYLPKVDYVAAESGYIQPYADTPLDDEPTGENVYLNLIQSARDSLYVMTPYLIISDEMNRELTLAAKRGVDVRVITPGIPDKPLIYKITRSYYAGLARGGVRIYEYTPGFLHAKQVLADGKTACVGTINFDFRSLYHHFENGALLQGYAAIGDIARDFQDTLALCREVTERYRTGRGAVLRIAQCILRLFAPLL